MKKTLIPFILICLSTSLFAQKKSWHALNIADSLKQKANAVFREHHTEVNLHSSNSMTTKKDVAVTILNKEGDGDGHVYIVYDKHTKIENFSAEIFNAFGKVIKKIKLKDLKDESLSDGISIYNDDRLKYYKHNALGYPYTIHYKYEVRTSNTAFIRNWLPINYYYASTESSSFKLTHPAYIKVRTKALNFEGYQILQEITGTQIRYQLTGAKAVEHESMSPSFLDFGPHVKFAANKFNISGVEGEANNWQEFGKWMYDKLLQGRDVLPENIKSEVRAMVKGIDDPAERAKLVYEYMQDKTRYISVQIGIGGWKPMLASEVEELRYGDCKALTNYTQALLKVANVPSYYTIIYADERRDIDSDLASIQGNHAILMVPTAKDTIWLECTSQKTPFGYMGDFTDNRDALVVTEEGGKIIRTKKYSNQESKQVIKGSIKLNENGSINAKATIVSRGVQYDDNFRIGDYKNDRRDRYYKSFFSEVHNVKIDHINLTNNKEDITFTEEIAFTADNYASKTGNRLLVRINAFNIIEDIPERDRNRQQPLEIEHGFIDEDIITIELPDNFNIEALAKNQKVETKFGHYTLKIDQLDNGQIQYKRTLLVKEGLYSASDYNLYRKFLKRVNILDQSKIVLIKA